VPDGVTECFVEVYRDTQRKWDNNGSGLHYVEGERVLHHRSDAGVDEVPHRLRSIEWSSRSMPHPSTG